MNQVFYLFHKMLNLDLNLTKFVESDKIFWNVLCIIGLNAL
jgi:hypothetical protein